MEWIWLPLIYDRPRPDLDVGWYVDCPVSVVNENPFIDLDRESPTYGHVLNYEAALVGVDKRDVAKCTKRIKDADVPKDCRLMYEMLILRPIDAAIEPVFRREHAAGTTNTPEGKEMLGRLLWQMRFRLRASGVRLPGVRLAVVRSSWGEAVGPERDQCGSFP